MKKLLLVIFLIMIISVFSDGFSFYDEYGSKYEALDYIMSIDDYFDNEYKLKDKYNLSTELLDEMNENLKLLMLILSTPMEDIQYGFDNENLDISFIYADEKESTVSTEVNSKEFLDNLLRVLSSHYDEEVIDIGQLAVVKNRCIMDGDKVGAIIRNYDEAEEYYYTTIYKMINEYYLPLDKHFELSDNEYMKYGALIILKDTRTNDFYSVALIMDYEYPNWKSPEKIKILVKDSKSLIKLNEILKKE